MFVSITPAMRTVTRLMAVLGGDYHSCQGELLSMPFVRGTFPFATGHFPFNREDSARAIAAGREIEQLLRAAIPVVFPEGTFTPQPWCGRFTSAPSKAQSRRPGAGRAGGARLHSPRGFVDAPWLPRPVFAINSHDLSGPSFRNPMPPMARNRSCPDAHGKNCAGYAGEPLL